MSLNQNRGLLKAFYSISSEKHILRCLSSFRISRRVDAWTAFLLCSKQAKFSTKLFSTRHYILHQVYQQSIRCVGMLRASYN